MRQRPTVTASSRRPRLSEEAVDAFRRVHITDALAELCMERGYRATTVGHIAARARMSKATIYGLFDGKDGVFMALLGRASGELSDLVDRHCAHPAGDGSDAIEVGLRAILHWVQGNVASAWALLVEAPAGPAGALQVQLELFASFGERLRLGHPGGEEIAEPVRDMLVGGVAAIIRGALLGGNAERIPAMLDGMVMYLDHPYRVRQALA